ncbi:hypothetical protein Ddye_012581 [Dipteronia dyeriana]|uniref:Uncharacterized protein n=1 Tax=Dipteronia dyeriana TaxID=168575 RepID=A0AAD9X4K6_9ROSI|nr:hypothetical protein Ddye_012581 [Dipteronia dyeriana]
MVYHPVSVPQPEVPISNVFTTNHQDIGPLDSALVHSSVGSDPSLPHSIGLVASLNSTPVVLSASISLFAAVPVLSVPVSPIVSRSLQTGKGSDVSASEDVVVSSAVGANVTPVPNSLVFTSVDDYIVLTEVDLQDSMSVIRVPPVAHLVQSLAYSIVSRPPSRLGPSTRLEIRAHQVLVDKLAVKVVEHSVLVDCIALRSLGWDQFFSFDMDPGV